MNVFFPDCENWLPKTLEVCRFVFALVGLHTLALGDSSVRAETLRVAVSDLPPSLGNPYTAMGVPGSHFWGSPYDGLTAIAPDGSIQPALAAAWTQASPNLWVFTLRTDATFHNGRPFDVGSVITTMNYLRSPDAGQYLLANEVKNIAGVRTLDEKTVEITTTTPDAALPRRLSLIMMIEPSQWTAYGVDAYALSPIGTGPFRFEEWGQGNRSAVMTAFTESFRHPQSVKTLEFIEVPNGVAREQALISGEVGLITSVNPDSMARLRDSGFSIQVHQRSQILSSSPKHTQAGLTFNVPSCAPSVELRSRSAIDRGFHL